MLSVIDDICRQELGITVRRSRVVGDGNSKETWALDTEDGKTIYFHRGTDRLRDEVALIRWIGHETPIPVTTVLAAGSTQNSYYFITEEIEGVSLDSQLTRLAIPTLQDIVNVFGRYLGMVHTLASWKEHGPLSVEENSFEVSNPYAGSSFLAYLWMKNIENLPPEMRTVGGRIENNIHWEDIPETVTAHVYPWDFRPGNMVYHAGKLAGILDWGEPTAAPAALGYAKVEYICLDWFGLDHLRRYFRSGYDSVRSVKWNEKEYAISRLVAIIQSAVDRNGKITRPGYPRSSETEALVFHRDKLIEAEKSL